MSRMPPKLSLLLPYAHFPARRWDSAQPDSIAILTYGNAADHESPLLFELFNLFVIVIDHRAHAGVYKRKEDQF